VSDLLKKYWIAHPTDVSRLRPGLMPLPSPVQMARWGREGTAKYLVARARAIAAAARDPLWHGFEPPAWTLWDALLGVPWLEAEIAKEIREALGFLSTLTVLWVFGANRSGKSMYSARTMSRLLWGRPGEPLPKEKVVTCFEATQAESREKMQSKMHYFMPEPYKTQSKGKALKSGDGVGYIKYLGVRGGFPDDIFVTPAGSYCRFKFYGQGEGIHEGGAQDGIWCSELVSAELVEKLQRGLADRQGVMVVDFTPILGYSPAVRMAMNAAHTVLESPAFLLPTDGGEPDYQAARYVEDLVWRARSLTTESTEGEENIPAGNCPSPRG
jgi:hypothetical protein